MLNLAPHMLSAYWFTFAEAARYGAIARLCQSPEFRGNHNPGFWLNEARKRLTEARQIRLGEVYYV